MWRLNKRNLVSISVAFNFTDLYYIVGLCRVLDLDRVTLSSVKVCSY